MHTHYTPHIKRVNYNPFGSPLSAMAEQAKKGIEFEGSLLYTSNQTLLSRKTAGDLLVAWLRAS
jgi:hypothetical protein